MSVDRRAFLFFLVTMFASLATALPAAANGQGSTKITGQITLRNGEVMNIRTADGKNVEVVLNPDTKLEEPQGVFGFRKKDLNITALAPGLNVTVQGLQYENNQLIAKTVTFSKQSLQSANGAQSVSGGQKGMENTANLSDYEVKATYSAHFAPGSALLSDADKGGLLQLAGNAAALSKYVIEVQGFADFPGNNAYDRQLSHDRAEAVIDFLRTSGRIPITRIEASGALAVSTPESGSEPPQGQAQNRRAEVKVLTNK